eukprot:Protomagalhaensia_wolfi_Nauph_80__4205@NODE_4288_length_601_cov_4_603203_g3416_i0_p1_GENE_NODE_4288_length_601_cov_4_603203_g3416_i0NODE_4288_length_601_cov_4_603203_g3416_i0_p1_ORF_typecomplete_len137_score28_71FhuF/PF06276_12/0_23_NODE_4288_length_601_cov_4_603203_g3416_i078488
MVKEWAEMLATVLLSPVQGLVKKKGFESYCHFLEESSDSAQDFKLRVKAVFAAPLQHNHFAPVTRALRQHRGLWLPVLISCWMVAHKKEDAPTEISQMAGALEPAFELIGAEEFQRFLSNTDFMKGGHSALVGPYL